MESLPNIMKKKEVRVRVKNGGMYQFILFRPVLVEFGKAKSLELLSERNIEIREAERVANELGVPVHTKNCKVFPKGKGMKDFLIPE